MFNIGVGIAFCVAFHRVRVERDNLRVRVDTIEDLCCQLETLESTCHDYDDVALFMIAGQIVKRCRECGAFKNDPTIQHGIDLALAGQTSVQMAPNIGKPASEGEYQAFWIARAKVSNVLNRTVPGEFRKATVYETGRMLAEFIRARNGLRPLVVRVPDWSKP